MPVKFCDDVTILKQAGHYDLYIDIVMHKSITMKVCHKLCRNNIIVYLLLWKLSNYDMHTLFIRHAH